MKAGVLAVETERNERHLCNAGGTNGSRNGEAKIHVKCDSRVTAVTHTFLSTTATTGILENNQAYLYTLGNELSIQPATTVNL